MPHRYNVKAFQDAAASGQSLLFLYSSLVGMELALKDHFGATAWRRGHYLIDWVAELGETSLSQQLRNRLAALFCTLPDGTEGNVDGNSYPGIRYLRHESDFPGKSKDAELQTVLDVVTDLRTQLAKQGIIF